MTLGQEKASRRHLVGDSAAVCFDARGAVRPVSRTLYGLFFEDINFACDGGLNANLVNNYSFDAVYLDRRLHSEALAFATRRRPRRIPDRTRHWRITGGDLASCDEDPLAPGTFFGRVVSHGAAVLENRGYPGNRAAIPARAGEAHLFRAWFRTSDFAGEIEMRLVGAHGRAVASARSPLSAGRWQRVATTLHSTESATVALEIVFHGPGRIDLDEVQLLPADHWGAGDPRWTQGLLRRDLVEALRDLKPTFMRFPGGCIVEGLGDGNGYAWKRTVGPLEQRQGDYNLWALRVPAGDYTQSTQIGFYEYFLLCEDLGMEPVPVVSAGMACQFRSRERLPVDGGAFDGLIRDVRDLIDWATADPVGNRWAALRAAAGHPEPFPLNYIGIGNENFGPGYLGRFRRIRDAVDAHRPGITAVLSSGAFPSGKRFDQAWAFARTQGHELVVDEHFYNSPKWFRRAATRYDKYPRGGPRVFVGEYAAHFPTVVGLQRRLDPANTFASALAEAAFLTGIERNADVVAMTSYAPLLNLVEHGQWHHNLIDFSPTAVLPTANYYVQQLFGTTVGERIVPIRGELRPGVYASSTTTGRRQSVKLVNTGRTAVDMVVEVPAAPDGSAGMTTLHAALSDRNTLPFSGAPNHAVRPKSFQIEVIDGAIRLTLQPCSVVALEIELA